MKTKKTKLLSRRRQEKKKKNRRETKTKGDAKLNALDHELINLRNRTKILLHSNLSHVSSSLFKLSIR